MSSVNENSSIDKYNSNLGFYQTLYNSAGSDDKKAEIRKKVMDLAQTVFMAKGISGEEKLDFMNRANPIIGEIRSEDLNARQVFKQKGKQADQS